MTPSLTAANEVATIINTLWASQTGKPTVLARLSPVFNTTDGSEAVPAAYSCPISHSLKRYGRDSYENHVTIAFMFISEADETAAQQLLTDIMEAVEKVLDTGSQNGVKFVTADISEPYDYDLLATAGIFRSQANIECLALTQRSA